MKNRSFVAAVIATGILLLSLSGIATAQTLTMQEPCKFTQRNLGGPRLGFTILPGDGKLRQTLDKRGIGTVISQFGWHWENRITTMDAGPAFITEWIFLVGGVEYGVLIPGLTLTFGVRLPQGFEFGLGPNLLIGGEMGASTALVIAMGKTFDFNSVYIPVNLAFVTSPTGSRLGFIFGYALDRSSG